MAIKYEETGIILNKKTKHKHQAGKKLIIRLLTGHSKDDYEIVEASSEILSEIKQEVDAKNPHKMIMKKVVEEVSILEKAKELKIKGAHLMSEETLKKKIEEKVNE